MQVEQSMVDVECLPLAVSKRSSDLLLHHK